MNIIRDNENRRKSRPQMALGKEGRRYRRVSEVYGHGPWAWNSTIRWACLRRCIARDVVAGQRLERVTGIEPAWPAWKSDQSGT
jgi:hypothetical protein